MSLEEAPEIYDRMVDWPKRLAREGPFYRRLFREHGVGRVLDCACGSGRHAAMFARWGLAVLGSDRSEAMIHYCRRRHGQHERLRWRVRSFDSLDELAERFQAVICVGNSLGLAGSESRCAAALSSMAGRLETGGVLVVHVLNFFSLPDGPTVVQKVLPVQQPDGAALLVKLFHRHGTSGYVDLLLLRQGSDAACTWRHEAARLIGLQADWLVWQLSRLGLSQIQTFGDYDASPYDAQHSPDLIATAVKAT